MGKKINNSLNVFRKTYFRQGKFIEDYSAFDGDVLDYRAALDGNGRSRIVGNSIFSPRIKRISYFPISLLRRNSKILEPMYALSIHSKLPNGIDGKLRFKDMNEIEVDFKGKSQEEIMSMVNDFLHMNNAEIMQRFGIERSWFSKETLDYMDKQDRKVLRRRKFEEKVILALRENKRLNAEIAKQKEDANSGNTIIHER